MNEFNALCKEFENMDAESYLETLSDLSARVLPALCDITMDGYTGSAIFAQFVLSAIVADGKLSEEEFVLAYPLFESFFGDSVDYESLKKAIRKMRKENKELKESTDKMVDLFGLISDELKNDIILIALMICAVDGKVSLREKHFINQLLD